MRRWLRRNFSAGGRVLWVAAALSFAAGLDPYRGQLSGLFLMTLGLTLSNVVVGWFYRIRLGGHLSLPQRAMAGSPISLRVTLINLSQRAGFDLEATLDRLPPGLARAGESLRLSRLDPGQSAELEVHFEALVRGRYRVGPAWVGSTYPLGIVRLGQALGPPQQLLVTPRIHPILSLDLNSGLRHQPGGVPLASQVGESLEFVGVRDYRQGDNPRKIHWKLWARRQEPVVREDSQEYFSRIGILLDTYRPPKPHHFEAALEVVASLAAYLEHSDSVVDFFAAGPQVHLLSMGRNQGSLNRVLEVLADQQSDDRPSYQGLLQQILSLQGRLSALLVISFEANPERQDFLRGLAVGGPKALRLLVLGPGWEEWPEATRLDPSQLSRDLEHL